MTKKSYLFLVLITFISNFSSGQNADVRWKENFIFEVKIINEFFDRFDADTSSDFLARFKARTMPERDVLIKTLFDRVQWWDTSVQNSFIRDVTSAQQPQYLSFFDDNWYALAHCNVIYQGKVRSLLLILKVEEGPDHSAKWVIVSAKGDFLNSKTAKIGHTGFPAIKYCGSDIRNAQNQTTIFLDPMSHGTNFMDLFDAFEDSTHFKDYICQGPVSSELVKLIQLVTTQKVKLKSIKHISYHLLQLKNWLLVVEYFNRESRNSGWLISNLIPVNSASKKEYEKVFLNVFPDE
ncbi:MAG: hypothetical protein IPP51_15275 [Bacteroidetes bacterium]|nr:hypothetical protein [Bacteroidota bacterium]